MTNLLTPSGSTSIQFQVEVGGELIAPSSVEAQIYKGSILTSITPSISNPSTGVYWVSFTVPSNWIDFDTASVRLNAVVNGMPITLTKPAGTVYTKNTNVDLTPVLDAIAALPDDSADIDAILAKVNQIVVSSGKVEATIGNQAVDLKATHAIKLLRLYQLFGFQYGKPAMHGTNYREVDGEWRVDITQPSPNVLQLSRLDPESGETGGANGGLGDYERSFTNSDLSIAGILSVLHNLNTYPSAVFVWDNNGENVWPDGITFTSLNQVAVDLSTFQPLTGTWKISIGV